MSQGGIEEFQKEMERMAEKQYLRYECQQFSKTEERHEFKVLNEYKVG